MKLSVLWPLNTGECMGRFDYNPLKQNYILKKKHFKKTLQGRSKNKSVFIRHGDILRRWRKQKGNTTNPSCVFWDTLHTYSIYIIFWCNCHMNNNSQSMYVMNFKLIYAWICRSNCISFSFVLFSFFLNHYLVEKEQKTLNMLRY